MNRSSGLKSPENLVLEPAGRTGSLTWLRFETRLKKFFICRFSLIIILLTNDGITPKWTIYFFFFFGICHFLDLYASHMKIYFYKIPSAQGQKNDQSLTGIFH